MAIISTDAEIDSVRLKEVSAPGTPASGYAKVYVKTDGKVYFKNDAGSESDLTATGSVTDVGARAYDASAQTLTTATTTAVNLDTENYDTDAFHDTVTNNERMTVPAGEGGKYLLVGCVFYDGHATGIRITDLYLNGTTVIANDRRDGSSSGNGVIVSTLYNLSAADYVEMRTYQNSGGNLDVSATTTYGGGLAIQKLA